MPTTIGVTSAVRHERTEGACGLTPLGSLRDLPIPQPYRPASSSPPLRLRQNLQGTGSLLRYVVRSLRRTPLPLSHSSGPRPRHSWSAPGSIPWAGSSPACPEGAPRCVECPRPRVIRIPRLCNPGVCLPELSYEGEDPYATCDHDKGVPLGHTLLAMQEVTWPYFIYNIAYSV